MGGIMGALGHIWVSSSQALSGRGSDWGTEQVPKDLPHPLRYPHPLRVSGTPLGKAASDQDCRQPRAEGGPRPQAQRQRGSGTPGTELGQPSRLPRCARTYTRTPPTKTQSDMSKDTMTHQCSRIPRPRPSHIAGTAVLYHQRTLGHAPIAPQCGRTGGSSPQGHSGLGAATPSGRPLGSSPASTARTAHAPQLYSVSVVHWERPDATVRHSVGPRRRPVSAQGVACPPSPAPLQPGSPRSQPASGHTHHAVLFKVCDGAGPAALAGPRAFEL
jgi:hypothetical protein